MCRGVNLCKAAGNKAKFIIFISRGCVSMFIISILNWSQKLIAALVPGAVKKEVYFMAIIDILTHYDAKKKAAHAAKTVKHGVSLLIF